MFRTDVCTEQSIERNERSNRLGRGGSVFTGEQVPNERIVRELRRLEVKAAARQQEHSRRNCAKGTQSADIEGVGPYVPPGRLASKAEISGGVPKACDRPARLAVERSAAPPSSAGLRAGSCGPDRGATSYRCARSIPRLQDSLR